MIEILSKIGSFMFVFGILLLAFRSLFYGCFKDDVVFKRMSLADLASVISSLLFIRLFVIF